MTGAIRILGIDPGLRRTGWGVVRVEGSRLAHVAHGVIAPPDHLALADRLLALFEAIEAVIAEYMRRTRRRWRRPSSRPTDRRR